jgi:hypothetical protein
MGHRGMRHTSTALYGASKKTLHKPGVTFRNMLFKISYSLNYYLQLYVNRFSVKLTKIVKNSLLALNSVFLRNLYWVISSINQ